MILIVASLITSARMVCVPSKRTTARPVTQTRNVTPNISGHPVFSITVFAIRNSNTRAKAACKDQSPQHHGIGWDFFPNYVAKADTNEDQDLIDCCLNRMSNE